MANAPRSSPLLQPRRPGVSRTLIALAGLFVLLSAALLPAQQPVTGQASIPVADFFRAPLIAKPALSPSGRYRRVQAGINMIGGMISRMPPKGNVWPRDPRG